MKKTVIIALTLFLSISSTIFCFNQNNFPITTIEKVASRLTPQLKELNKNAKLTIDILPNPIPLQTRGRWTGRERDLSFNNEYMLNAYDKAFNQNMKQLYEKEIEFIDSDNKKYWIPTQKTFHQAFKEEVETNVILFLRFLGFADNKPVVVMVEFEAK